MENSKNLPRRKNIRLKGYDYSTPAYYFITTVVHNHLCLFGNILNDEMVLNNAGRMVMDVIENIAKRFKETLIPYYVIMPNHLHLIIQNAGGTNIMDIMRWLKSITTNKYIHGVKEEGWAPFHETLWQRNYYDHIIRNQHSFEFIANYIIINPKRWKHDKLNTECVETPDNINEEIKKLEG